MSSRFQLLVYFCFLVHFTFTTDETYKNSYLFNHEQSNDCQFKVESIPNNSTFDNNHFLQNTLNDDKLFNCNKIEILQNRKRKRRNNQNYLNEEALNNTLNGKIMAQNLKTSSKIIQKRRMKKWKAF
jgi:hypothetical protein